MNYLSPSSFSLFRRDRDLFVRKYFGKWPKESQTFPMAVGSAFDAFVKADLATRLGLGKPEFAFETMFQTQVEAQHRDEGRKAGKVLYEAYSSFGCLADLLKQMQTSRGVPAIETSVSGVVGGVPLLGKPDIRFSTSEGLHVVWDFKVNGWVTPASPKPRYVIIRPTGTRHKDAIVEIVGGIPINVNGFMEDVDADWATQLAIYAWLCGETPGGGFVVAIDQLVIRDGVVRVAEHRNLIGESFQLQLLRQLQDAWICITNDWLYPDLTHQESIARQEMVCQQMDGFGGLV